MADDRNRDPRRHPPRRESEQDRAPRMNPIDPGRLGLPRVPVADLNMAGDALEHAAREGFNVLAPITAIQFLPPHHQVAIRAVQFDASFTQEDFDNRGNGTYYLTDKGLYAHARPALDMLGAAAGLDWLPDQCRSDNTGIELVWRYLMAARIKAMDGQWRRVARGKTLDLRDGSPMIAGWSGKRLAMARTHGAAMAETMAANRVVRVALSLKGGYTARQAALPFVFPCLIYTMPDTPETRVLQAAAELGLGASVFGPVLHRARQAEAGSSSAPAPAAAPRQAARLEDRGPPRDLAAELAELERRDQARERVPARSSSQAHRDERRDPRARDQEGDVWDEEDEEDERGTRPDPRCDECGVKITPAVASYSQDRHRRPLCLNHQPRR